MSFPLYRWHLHYEKSGYQEDRNVVAANANEALRTALPVHPLPCHHGAYAITSIVRHERIDAIWEPIPEGPRPATVEEQAAAEVERMLA